MSPGSDKRDSADLTGVRSVLFVCMGNICRSPTAQGVFEHLADVRQVRSLLRVESRGTGDWHQGEPPDPRAISTAAAHGVVLRSRARMIEPAADFREFDLILPMDQANHRHLCRLGCPAEKIVLFRRFEPALSGARIRAPEPQLEVPDPYHSDVAAFETVFEIVWACSQGLLDAMFPKPTKP